jgi:hypothetical protein
MPTEKEVLAGLLSRAYQFDNDGVTSLYNEDGTELKPDALDVILSKDADRIAALKFDVKKTRDEGYMRGQSESLTNYEKAIAAKYGLKTDKKGIEFIDELVAQFNKDHADDPDKIKKSKIFIDEIERMNAEKNDIEARYKGELDAYKKQVEREKLFNIVVEDALIQFENMRPILPQDAAKAANLKKIFINDLATVDYIIREGKKILVNPDGSDMLDQHGIRVPFDGFVKATAEKYFDFHVSESKSNANHRQNNNNQSSTVFNITSEQDYLDQRAVTPEKDRPALKDAFDKWRGRK